jgi:hypothetical protein
LLTVDKPREQILELVMVLFQERANVVVAHGQTGSRRFYGVCNCHGLVPVVVVSNRNSKARAALVRLT